MNLILDIGNSRIKVGVFSQEGLCYQGLLEKEGYSEQLTSLGIQYPQISHSLVCNVGTLPEGLLTFLERKYKVLVLDSTLKLPYQINYATPKTLGADRIALVASAYFQFPNEPSLIIDMGSCITYDFLDTNGVYQGGAITPGWNMRLRAMKYFTEKLPLLKPSFVPKYVGSNTEDCMQAGAAYGLLDEMDGMINRYKRDYKGLTVILTGGDAEIFGKRLKNSIFANSNFLMEGCNVLLEYNKS